MLYPVPISSIYDVEENQTCHIRGEPVPLNVHLKDVPCPPHTNVYMFRQREVATSEWASRKKERDKEDQEWCESKGRRDRTEKEKEE